MADYNDPTPARGLKADMGRLMPERFVKEKAGVQTVATNIGGTRIYNDSGRDLTIQKVHVSVNTAPTGSALVVDVHKEGTTIFTTQANRPSVAVSAFAGSAVPAVTAWPADSWLTVDVDVIGSTVAGSDLRVTILAG
jgi:hypothetical protein